MAKKWGKRGKGGGRTGAQIDPFAMQARPPAPRSAPPASSTPLSDYLRRQQPGVTDGYVVLPRTLVEDMPLPWQQQLVNLLAQFHEGHARLDWPAYRVVPSRPERLVDLDEEQLAEVGYVAEIDADGEMVYRERSGRKVDDPESVTVLVSCLDPVVRETRAEPAPEVPDQGKAAPMNIGPQPVWETPPSGFSRPTPPPVPGTPAQETPAPSSPPAPSGGAVPPTRPAEHAGPSPAGPPSASVPPGPVPPAPPQSTPAPGGAPAGPPPPPAGPQPAGPAPAGPSSVEPAGATPPPAGPSPAYGQQAEQQPSTPSRGERDWFDEMPPATDRGPTAQAPADHNPAAQPPAAQDAAAQPSAGPDTDTGETDEPATSFGPTGDEPTEIPYRFRG